MERKCTGNLLLISNYPPDTAYAWWLMEHFWTVLAEQFARQGRKAYLAYPKLGPLSPTIAAAPIEAVELTLPWVSRKQAAKACSFMKEKRIEYVYFTDQPYFSMQYRAMRLNGVRRIIVHDHTPGDRPPVAGFKGAVKAVRNVLPWFTADRVICVSALMRQRNITNGRVPVNKCVVVQNGIRPISCDPGKRNIVRERLAISRESIIVSTTGRAHPYKRFDFIIDCARVLRDTYPELDVVFLLVGDGPALPDLKNQVRNLDLEKTVHLLGFRMDVPDILCACDIAIHAALGEGFSLSIIEHMSAGLPVLVPDIPSVRQAIRHNQTGLVYPATDVTTAAGYIAALAMDSSRRKLMAQAAKHTADTEYSLEQCTEEFRSTVAELFWQAIA